MNQTPRLVAFSLWLYRLLLTAYPNAFRQEYGEAMTQLFRDTALDGYQRRGTLGLVMVWLWTLLDFRISVVRQHREEIMGQSEALSLRYLIQRWLTLGGILLSVTVLSMRYALHVVLRRPLWTCTVVSVSILVLWSWTLFFHKLGIFGLGPHTNLEIHAGVIEFRHIYARSEPISMERFIQNPQYRFNNKQVMPWEFSFSSENWVGSFSIGSEGYACKYWRLRFPVPTLFVFVILFYTGTRGRLRGTTVPGSAMQSA